MEEIEHTNPNVSSVSRSSDPAENIAGLRSLGRPVVQLLMTVDEVREGHSLLCWRVCK
jgi:hypothetical protein